MSYQISVKSEIVDALLFRENPEEVKVTISKEEANGNQITSIHTGSGKDVTQQFKG